MPDYGHMAGHCIVVENNTRERGKTRKKCTATPWHDIVLFAICANMKLEHLPDFAKPYKTRGYDVRLVN